MSNSINEKCTRIRAAFVGEFDEYMAKSYYIDGPRGDVKKIALPRNRLVVIMGFSFFSFCVQSTIKMIKSKGISFFLLFFKGRCRVF